MILSSFQAQYGIRLTREISSMKWDEFKDLLVGIGPDTPLGRMVAIRAENDREILKHFTADQHKIRNEWISRQAARVEPQEMENILESIKNAFVQMAK